MNRVAALLTLLGAVAPKAILARDVPLPEQHGVGVVLVGDGPIVVAKCSPNGPAHAAGIAAGDTLVALDGQSIAGWQNAAVRDYLVRDAAGPVAITVRRGTGDTRFEIERMRMDVIQERAGLRFLMREDSSYVLVPLNAPDPLLRGSAVDIPPLQAPDCQPAHVSFEPAGETLIYFWASWCGPCKQFMRQVNTGALDTFQPSLRILGVNVDEKCSTFAAVVDSLAPPGDQYWEGMDGNLGAMLGLRLRGIPIGALIVDGRLYGVTSGASRIVALLKEHAAAKAKDGALTPSR